MKLEKECYIGQKKYTEYDDGKYNLSFNCIIYGNLNEEEMKTFLKLYKKTKVKLTLEAEDSILDEKERKYLSGVIRPFRDRITDIIKHKSYDFENKEYIVIHCNQSETTLFPYFEKGSMYKGMELNKEYTLKELGL